MATKPPTGDGSSAGAGASADAERDKAKAELDGLLQKSGAKPHKPRNFREGMKNGVSNMVGGAVGAVGVAVLAPTVGVAAGAQSGGILGGIVGLTGGCVGSLFVLSFCFNKHSVFDMIKLSCFFALILFCFDYLCLRVLVSFIYPLK